MHLPGRHADHIEESTAVQEIAHTYRPVPRTAAEHPVRRWCDTARCTTAHDADTTVHGRYAPPGSWLCGHCKDALLRDLAAIPELFRESEQYLQTGDGGGGPVERLTGSRTNSTPVNDDVLEARHETVVRLAKWARTAVNLAPSAAAPARTVAAMAAFLLQNAESVTTVSTAGRMADEMAGAAAALRRLGGPGPAALLLLGHCVEPGCGAEVTLPRRGGDGVVLRGPSCTAGHILTPRQWLALKDAA
ncbi:hypothetical protein N566_25210 [Streptomycetaceae bacterium MP113-05]|nr:hypothetical protein N566_25210 [Streptomycetaceae bacterium MP113-05]